MVVVVFSVFDFLLTFMMFICSQPPFALEYKAKIRLPSRILRWAPCHAYWYVFLQLLSAWYVFVFIRGMKLVGYTDLHSIALCGGLAIYVWTRRRPFPGASWDLGV